MWTPERIEKLTQMWRDGVPAREIAAALGGGMGRNAVISKAHRIHLGPHGSAVRK